MQILQVGEQHAGSPTETTHLLNTFYFVNKIHH